MARSKEEIKKDAKDLLRRCNEAKTLRIIDKEGRVWEFGKWYGEPWHFRTNFGHWSEMVITTENFDAYAPYEPFVGNDNLGDDWREFYKGDRT